MNSSSDTISRIGRFSRSRKIAIWSRAESWRLPAASSRCYLGATSDFNIELSTHPGAPLTMSPGPRCRGVTVPLEDYLRVFEQVPPAAQFVAGAPAGFGIPFLTRAIVVVVRAIVVVVRAIVVVVVAITATQAPAFSM